MKDLPFDAYDFFGYIASGLLVLLTMERVFGFPSVSAAGAGAVQVTATFLGAYIAGHATAGPAKLLLEDFLAKAVLGAPSVWLMKGSASSPRKCVFGLVIPGCYRPLHDDTVERLNGRIGCDHRLSGEALFERVRFSPEVLGNEQLMGRLSTFLNKYGFARNIAFASLLAAAAFGARSCLPEGEDSGKYALASLVAGVLMTLRYLKFFRLYSYELFATYALADADDSADASESSQAS